MDIQATLADFYSRIEQYTTLKASIVEDLKQDLPGFIEKVLKAADFPFMEMRGYTPGFNDGDPCEFGVHMDMTYGFGEYQDRFENAFENADFSNLDYLTWEHVRQNGQVRARANQVQKIFYDLQEILEDALEGNFSILAAFDATGAFYCEIDTEYECGY